MKSNVVIIVMIIVMVVVITSIVYHNLLVWPCTYQFHQQCEKAKLQWSPVKVCPSSLTLVNPAFHVLELLSISEQRNHHLHETFDFTRYIVVFLISDF